MRRRHLKYHLQESKVCLRIQDRITSKQELSQRYASNNWQTRLLNPTNSSICSRILLTIKKLLKRRKKKVDFSSLAYLQVIIKRLQPVLKANKMLTDDFKVPQKIRVVIGFTLLETITRDLFQTILYQLKVPNNL